MAIGQMSAAKVEAPRKDSDMPTANASILVAAASASTTRVLEKSIVRLREGDLKLS